MPEEGVAVRLLVTIVADVEIVCKAESRQVPWVVPDSLVLQLILLMPCPMCRREDEGCAIRMIFVGLIIRPRHFGIASKRLAMLAKYKGQGAIGLPRVCGIPFETISEGFRCESMLGAAIE